MATGLEGFRRPVIVCYYFAATTRQGGSRSGGCGAGGVHEEFEGESGETVESKTESSEVYDSVFTGEII
jgi:hypothetical protein